MKTKGLLILLLMVFVSDFMVAQDASTVTKSQVLFTKVNIFDGVNDKLMMKANVLVENNLIK